MRCLVFFLPLEDLIQRLGTKGVSHDQMEIRKIHTFKPVGITWEPKPQLKASSKERADSG